METAISAIVLDIDGTLVPPGGQLSNEDLAVLKRCQKRGIDVCVATARPPHLVLRSEEAPEDAGFLRETGVFYSGALIVEEKTGFRASCRIEKSDLRAASAFLEGVNSETLQAVIQGPSRKHAFRLPVKDSMLDGWGISTDDVIEWDEALENGCYRLSVFHVECGQKVVGIKAGLKSAMREEVRFNTYGEDACLEILAAEATKTIAVRRLLKVRGIDPGNVVVFGNDEFDLGLFEMCGIAVCPSDAAEIIRDKASFVSLPCGENAIAHAVKKLEIM